MTNSKARAIALLNKLDDLIGESHAGTATVLSGPIQTLRRAIHREMGAWDVEDLRLEPLPTCGWCWEVIEEAPHDPDICIRTLLLRVLEKTGKT